LKIAGLPKDFDLEAIRFFFEEKPMVAIGAYESA
jgi:hypothetical protein